MSNPVPKYSLWEAINVAISLGTRALEEIRALARIPGPRGADGLGFDDVKFIKVDDRNFMLVFERGKEIKKFPFSIDCMIYRDVFSDGQSYQKGDVVTWGGCMYVAREETTLKPNDGLSWRLAVKKGRDGRDTVSIPIDPKKPVKV